MQCGARREEQPAGHFRQQDPALRGLLPRPRGGGGGEGGGLPANRVRTIELW